MLLSSVFGGELRKFKNFFSVTPLTGYYICAIITWFEHKTQTEHYFVISFSHSGAAMLRNSAIDPMLRQAQMQDETFILLKII